MARATVAAASAVSVASEGPNDAYDATDLPSPVALSVAVVALEGPVVTSIAASVSGA